MVCVDKVYSGYYRLYSIAWVLQLCSLLSTGTGQSEGKDNIPILLQLYPFGLKIEQRGFGYF